MYALLKRLRYPSLKFLQYSIDSNLTQNLGTSQTNLSSVVIDINANNPVYLQNLLNAYKTFQPCDLLDAMSSSSSDKDSMPCYGSDFQITTSAQCDERKLYARKEDILHEVLNMLPLLKPGNEEAKLIYLTLIPVAVKDTSHRRCSKPSSAAPKTRTAPGTAAHSGAGGRSGRAQTEFPTETWSIGCD